MLEAAAVILLIAWALGFGVFHVANAAIHLLLLVAVVVGVIRLVQWMGGRRTPL